MLFRPLRIMLLLALGIAGCSALGPSEADLTATAVIERTAQAVVQQNAQTAQASTATAQVRATEALEGLRFLIVNHSSVTFCRVYISATTAADWENNAAFDQVITAGSQADIRVAYGEYDLRIDDCEGNLLVDAYSVNVPEVTTWTLTDEDLRP